MNTKQKVILFGRGMVFQRKKERLFDLYEVTAILDNSIVPISKYETESLAVANFVDPAMYNAGIILINPKDIGKYPETIQQSDVPIVLLSYALGDMYRQLLGLGIAAERIWFGPMIEPYNTFEKMLFEDGGKLVAEGKDIYYHNQKINLYLKTNPSALEMLTDALKKTPLYRHSDQILKALPLSPLDDTYGMNRGTPVDRYYIEKFLSVHSTSIRGTVMEVGDREYTKKFGADNVIESLVLHVEEENPELNQIKGDFTTGDGLIEESIDCLICTQTLPFIYDLFAAADHIVKILKKGGIALITVAGISQIIQYEKLHYGHFWSFTDQSLKRLFEENSDIDLVDVTAYGNVKASTAFLYGIGYEELKAEDLDFHDPNYQLIVAAVVKKKERDRNDNENITHDPAGSE